MTFEPQFTKVSILEVQTRWYRPRVYCVYFYVAIYQMLI